MVVTRCDFNFRKISLVSLRRNGVGVEERVKAETSYEVLAVGSLSERPEDLD